MTSTEQQTFEYNPSKGEAAFAAIRGRLADVNDGDFSQLNVNPQSVAIAALRVADQLADPKVAARFGELPASVFDPSLLQNFATFAWATLYASRRLISERDAVDKGRVEPSLIEQAVNQRQQMWRVVEYHLGHDAELAPEIDAIRRGAGHVDLANDLDRLADIYEENQAILRHDLKFFRPEAVAEARGLAEAIVTQLAGNRNGDFEEWRANRRRVFSLLRSGYETIQAAAGLLFIGDDAMLEKFPPLVGMIRRTRRTPVVSDDAPVNTPEDTSEVDTDVA